MIVFKIFGIAILLFFGLSLARYILLGLKSGAVVLRSHKVKFQTNAIMFIIIVLVNSMFAAVFIGFAVKHIMELF